MDRKDSKIILGGRVEGNMFVIHVTDNGCGMPDQVKQNLFKKFYSTKGSEGTGLGLVVTKKIIEEHGGRIQVYSRLGEGTSFQIEIPTSPIQESQEPKSMVLQ
jgi:signal transduction histidine kinase